MRKIGSLALGVLALVLAPALAQEGGDPPPAPAPVAPPAPAAKKAVKDPSRAVADRIQDSLKAVLTSTGAARLSAQASLEGAVAEWAADAKDDPLRAVKWWRTALQGTLPSGSARTGLEEKKIPFGEGKEARIWVSVPKGYSAKNSYPLLLCIVDRDEEPRRAIPAMYPEAVKEWIVVGISVDPKQSGLDLAKEPGLVSLGLRYAIENYRVDRDRQVLDASPGASNLALALGTEWVVQFAGCVLRGPNEVSPLASNLELTSVLIVPPETPNQPQKNALEQLRKAAPAATVAADLKQPTPEVQKWLAAVPPRRISNPETGSFSWKARPQGGEAWAWYVWVWRPADFKRDRLVTITVTRDLAGGIVDLKGDNVAEGRLLLNDDLIDLDRPVIVRFNGKEVWKGTAERRLQTAIYWIGQTGERTLFAPAEVQFTVKPGS